MSHELRTPLNSLLILSDQLSKNNDGNLTPRQTEFAKTIHSSGNDLLNLINDILDLSKIESGTVQVDIGELQLADLRSFVERTFRHVAESKTVDFVVEFDEQLPASMLTDSKRLQQIIKNLLSNAFKFTHHGRVSLLVHAAEGGWSDGHDDLNRSDAVLAFDVADTGIGISPDKQQIIFEAFQQADGSTSRKYGGTGLGLAISRELSRLLGGEIRLVSRPGFGSTFTLYIPQNYSPPRVSRKAQSTDATTFSNLPGQPRQLLPTSPRKLPVKKSNGAGVRTAPPKPTPPVELVNEVDDDRDHIRAGDRVLLIVENDTAFARFLLDVAREHGMKGLVTSLGAAALALAKEYKPHAVTLDIFLPDIEGWRVLERLKSDLAARHTPVCVISTEEARARALASGAVAFVAKPIQSREVLDGVFNYLSDFISRPKRHVVVVEPDANRRREIIDLVAADDVEVSTPAGSSEALSLVSQRSPDCVVVHPGETAFAQELAALKTGPSRGLSQLPVLVYGPGHEDGGVWNRVADTCTLRRVDSRERLLDLTMLFTHRTVGQLPAEKRQMLVDLHDSDRILADKKVLIVDDDMRNIFALATVLEEHAMQTISADNGRDAIRLLQTEPNIDIVLMDIMMPELDGMETIREIRRDPKLRKLPIVAVTAKAMKGDREKCIEAGAWDYLSKPVDTEQLLAVLRAWLHA
jgi:CheY-like chemotaxis protein